MTAIRLRYSHKTDAQLLKEINETRLLNLIERTGPLSRTDISKQAHMAKATVSEIIGRLIGTDLVEEIGKGDSTSRGGKRPTMIQINPTGRYLFGVDIKRDQSQIQLTNLNGDEIDMQFITYPVGSSNGKVVRNIMDVMHQQLLTHKISKDRLLSIGISIPGLVDYQNGELWMADTLPGWDHLPINAVFEREFAVPCLIENDVKCTAWGERLHGVGQDSDGDLICIFLGDGIGAGIIHDEHILRGHSGGAGEIGYIQVHCPALQDGKYLLNGQKYYGELLGMASLKAGFGRAGIDLDAMGFDDLLASDEADVEAVLDEYAQALASLTQNLVKTLNPRTVIFTGKPVERSTFLSTQVQQYIEAGLTASALHLTVDVKVGTLGPRAALAGAVALAKQTLFKPVVAQHFTPDMSLESNSYF